MASPNKEQRLILDFIRSGKNVFGTGPGGCGKSFIVKLIRKEFPNAWITSTTGASAVQLECRAQTFHSWAGINPNSETQPYGKTLFFIRKFGAGDRICDTRLLVIDEISMLSASLLELVDRICRDVRQCARPFGGIQVVALGDFLQLQPVRGEFCFKSPVWTDLFPNMVSLIQPMRQKDPEFYKILMDLRAGRLTKESEQILRSRIKVRLGKPSTIIVSLNADVRRINCHFLKKLKDSGAVCHTYKADICGPLEKTVHRYMMAEPELELAQGALVMLLANLDLERGLCNGASGKIVGFTGSKLPLVKFACLEEPEVIQPHRWVYEGKQKTTYIQLPLKLLYATSIHKIQGKTLDAARINLDDTVFDYGQAYVALSRVRRIGDLNLLGFDPKIIKAHPDAIKFYYGSSSNDP